ncbi:MAG: hypothetical protein RL172_2373 [Bacteroidota bacterium]
MLHKTYKSEIINKAEQLLQECAGWLRLLDFVKQENAYLKTRLSLAVDHKTDKEFLNQAEHFQNEFILKDEYINEIAKDAKLQEDRIKEIVLLQKNVEDKYIRQQQKLRNEIEYLEKDFTRMKYDFNKQLFSIT